MLWKRKKPSLIKQVYEIENLVDAWRKVRSNVRVADRKHSQGVDEVRGQEGTAGVAYYEAFGQMIKVPGFSFKARTRRPPRDPVNALLSLGYTLLHNNVYAMINVVGLDPYQGFLHMGRYGHPTLASDLMEEFRAIILRGR